jgi:NADH-quinone oxidoreductase subunit G
MVVTMSPFKTNLDISDVLLPVSPFTETAGTFVNTEARAQSFHGVVKPLGETRPAWKVLRVLGNMLDVPGFEFETSESVRAEALGELSAVASRLGNAVSQVVTLTGVTNGLERVSDVPIYETDPMVRRAASLQHTANACAPVVGISADTAARLGLSDGTLVRVSQGTLAAELPVRIDATLAPQAVRVSAGRAKARTLGPMFGPIALDQV